MLQVLELNVQTTGKNHINYATALNNLATLYDKLGRYEEAEPYHLEALELRKKLVGTNSEKVASSLTNIAIHYAKHALYEDADQYYVQSLEIKEKRLGPNHPSVALTLSSLGALLQTLGRYEASDRMLKRAEKIREKVFTSDDPQVAYTLNNTAVTYLHQGRFAEAEKLLKRALAIREKHFPPEHPLIGSTVNNLAGAYHEQGRYEEAVPLHRRALAIREKTLGVEDRYVAQSLHNLGITLRTLGRRDEAIPLHERAFVIREKALGANHPDVAQSIRRLAVIKHDKGQYEEAETLYKRALAIQEKSLGSEHPTVASTLSSIGRLMRQQLRYDEAEPLFTRALKIREKALGLEHPTVASTLDEFALLHQAREKFAEAEPLFRKGLGIRERALGADHPKVAGSYYSLAGNYELQERYDEALDTIRRASDIHRGRMTRTDARQGAGTLTQSRRAQNTFFRHAFISGALYEASGQQNTQPLEESFEIAQLAGTTAAASAVARMAARFAAGDDALAALVRRRQDAVLRFNVADASIVKAVGQAPNKRDRNAESRLRVEIEQLNTTIAAMDARITEAFPEYATLANPLPLALNEAQGLLAPDEAIVTWLLGATKSLLWVVRKDDAKAFVLDVKAADVSAAVKALRQALDPAGVARIEDLPRFPVAQAHKLYEQIFAPAEELLGGTRLVFIVPNGALQSLPAGVLVTEAPTKVTVDIEDYRDVPWLAKRYAMTVLPSVRSLKALRVFAGKTAAKYPFAGFGDPVLNGEPGGGRSNLALALYQRGSLADVSKVRDLPRLPETADELQALATSLRGRTEDVFLRNRATEGTVKGVDLSQYRVLAFATHGLTAGDFAEVGEPALVMTPPVTASDEDDGLLTAGEVAHLRLNADWVVLSACNTAAPDGSPGAEGLSGLARAFFYAGSRALLVSHWPVDSQAATRLTTRLFSISSAEPALGRAEALQRSMLELMKSVDRPYYAHPIFWAPFVVVGEGGAA